MHVRLIRLLGIFRLSSLSFHNEDICSICEVQDITRRVRIRRRAWRDHVNRMDDNWLVKIAKNGKPNTFGPPRQSLKR
jgi:hypothetical protein